MAKIVFNEVLLTWDAAHSKLLMQPSGKVYYQLFMFPPGIHRKVGSLCSGLCGHNLKRFHLSCLTCRLRRVYFGKMRNPVPVTPYVILLRNEKKKPLALGVKTLLTIVEFIDNLF